MILTALSAKYVHKTLAPWCLKSYCDTKGDWDIEVFEASINDDLARVSREIFLRKPAVLGLSCYIWNIDQTRRLATMVRKMLPDCVIVFGGPEVSYGGEYAEADYVLQGAGEVIFADLLAALRQGERPAQTAIAAKTDAYPNLPSPYTPAYFASFGQGGIQNHLVYYESTRGCPFACSYCLSSALNSVSYKPLDEVFAELSLFLAQGARVIKFVDRTFNANRKRAAQMLEWILALDTDCTFHFEVAADLFDQRLLALLAAMPKGRVQLEIGIQSVHPPTLAAIHRVADTTDCLNTISALTGMGNFHVHVDLIAGMPYETMQTFAEGFNACMAVKPQMLQLGFLKVLRGTCMRKEAQQYGIVYHENAPYEVVSTPTMSCEDLIFLKGVEEVTDKFYNAGLYPNSLDYAASLFASCYDCYVALAAHCKGKNLRVSLKNSYAILLEFLVQHGNAATAAHCIRLDCLTFDAKGQLPDALSPNRDKLAERACRKMGYRHFRVERFADGSLRLFDYDAIDPISRACTVTLLDESTLYSDVQ